MNLCQPHAGVVIPLQEHRAGVSQHDVPPYVVDERQGAHEAQCFVLRSSPARQNLSGNLCTCIGMTGMELREAGTRRVMFYRFPEHSRFKVYDRCKPPTTEIINASRAPRAQSQDGFGDKGLATPFSHANDPQRIRGIGINFTTEAGLLMN